LFAKTVGKYNLYINLAYLIFGNLNIYKKGYLIIYKYLSCSYICSKLSTDSYSKIQKGAFEEKK